jgi:hypothetical protein
MSISNIFYNIISIYQYKIKSLKLLVETGKQLFPVISILRKIAHQMSFTTLNTQVLNIHEPPALMIINSPFSPLNVFMGFVLLSEQIALNFLNSVNRHLCTGEMLHFFVAQTKFLTIICASQLANDPGN